MAKFDRENMKVGRIVMSRRYGAGHPTQHCVRLEDASSDMTVAEIQMTPEQFAGALQCCTEECRFIVNQSPAVGNKSEHKTIEIKRPIDLPPRGEDRDKLLRSLVAAHETNGWIGSWQDLDNMHNIVQGKRENGHWYFRVGFHRYVDEQGDFIPLVDASKLVAAARVAMNALMMADPGDDDGASNPEHCSPADVTQYLLENEHIIAAAFSREDA